MFIWCEEVLGQTISNIRRGDDEKGFLNEY